jgi:hypothetical protein
MEHGKWFPHCQFVLLNQGTDFIDKCNALRVEELRKQELLEQEKDLERQRERREELERQRDEDFKHRNNDLPNHSPSGSTGSAGHDELSNSSISTSTSSSSSPRYGSEFGYHIRNNQTQLKSISQPMNGVISSSSNSPSAYQISSSDETPDELAIRVVDQWMKSDIVIKLLDLNSFSIDMIKACLDRRWSNFQQPYESFDALYNDVSKASRSCNTSE